MEKDRQDLFQWCSEHADEHLGLLKELSAIPASFHQKEKRMLFILEWLKSQGVEEIYVDRAFNVVLPLRCERQTDITIYMAHSGADDLTPLHECEVESRQYADGIDHGAANVATLLMCVKYLLVRKRVAREPVLIVFNSCWDGKPEKSIGVRQIINDYASRIKEFIFFGSERKTVCNRTEESERWRVHTSTVGDHSTNAFGNSNAIAYIASLVTKLYRQEIPHTKDGKTTFNVETIRGDTSNDTITQAAEILYEYRSEDKQCLEQMRKQFFKLLAEEANRLGANFEVNSVKESPCNNNAPSGMQGHLFERYAIALEEVIGNYPSHDFSPTLSTISLPMGIPAVSVDLHVDANVQPGEECVEVDSLQMSLMIAIRLIAEHFLPQE